jgi:hypothetical protein
MVLATLRSSIDEYARGKRWYWYVPLWLFGIFVCIKLFGFDMFGGLPIVLAIPYSFDFLLHELAHIVTGFLPPLLTASAGSISELMLGIGLVLGGFYWRNYFAVLFCMLWLDLACQSAGTYMADAVPQQVPLVSLGGALSGQDPLHDWNYVFGQLHLLGASDAIGTTLRVIGNGIGLFGLAFAAWIIYKMAASASLDTTQPPSNSSAKRPHLVATVAAPSSPRSIYPEPTQGPFAEHHDPRADHPTTRDRKPTDSRQS